MMPVSVQDKNKSGGNLARPINSMACQDNAATLLLDERGIICGCNGASEKLFGYPRREMVQQHVAMLIPRLEYVELIEDGQPSSRFRFFSHISGYFQMLSRSGEQVACQLYLLNMSDAGTPELRLIVRPCRS